MLSFAADPFLEFVVGVFGDPNAASSLHASIAECLPQAASFLVVFVDASERCDAGPVALDVALMCGRRTDRSGLSHLEMEGNAAPVSDGTLPRIGSTCTCTGTTSGARAGPHSISYPARYGTGDWSRQVRRGWSQPGVSTSRSATGCARLGVNR